MQNQSPITAEAHVMADLLTLDIDSKQFELQLNSIFEQANPPEFKATQKQLTSFFAMPRVAPSRTNVLELQYRGLQLK